MINKALTKSDILNALSEIDKSGVPLKRKATRYNLYYKGKSYPPKYVLSMATELATSKELKPSGFGGGDETNGFLQSLGFTIRAGANPIPSLTKKPPKNAVIICTALFQISETAGVWEAKRNKEKLKMLGDILQKLNKRTDILILPAGFLNTKKHKPNTIYGAVEHELLELIAKHCPKLTICFGIDGRDKTDQIALAINKKGIISIARKFYHEGAKRNLAASALEIEENHKRFFKIKGNNPYIAVCWDIKGIYKTEVENKGFDFIIDVVHGFDNDQNKADVDFARKCLAGASKYWGVPVYASALFSDNRKAESWPSGVRWQHGEASVRDFSYDDIAMKGEQAILVIETGKVYLNYFNQ